ncbi:MAG: methyltransferase domain-containing protein [bacterium]
MGYVDKTRFSGSIYLGLPANFNDKIILRRINLIDTIPDFYNKNLNMVEVGCGNGATSLRLAEKFNKIDCLDISPLNQNDFENYKNKLHVHNCNFSIVNIENQNELKNKYDRLICFEVIEHFSDDSSVSKLFDMLKSGGKAAITVPNKWWIFETHGAKLPFLKWNRVPFFSWLPKPIHQKYANARIYTSSRIVKLLQNAGFIVKDVKYITAPMDVLKEGKLKDLLTNFLFKNNTTKIPIFSTSIFISAEKS